MNKSIYQYSLRIWLTTLLVSPPIAFIVSYTKNVNSFWEIIAGLFLFEGYAIGFGLLFSLPSVVLFYFVSLRTSKLSAAIRSKRLILISFASTLLLITFSILLGGLNQLYNFENVGYISSYGLVVILSLIFYKLPFERKQQPTGRL